MPLDSYVTLFNVKAVAEGFKQLDSEIDAMERNVVQAIDKATAAEKKQMDLQLRHLETLRQSTKEMQAWKAGQEAGISAMARMGQAMMVVGAATVGLIAKTTQLAARSQTLGVVMQLVGKQGGYTKFQLDALEQTLKKQGIASIEARESITRLVQAQVDLTKASQLARVAQDAAVIGGINSSEAFERITHGLTTQNILVLRNVGLMVDFIDAQDKAAKALGISRDEMTQAQIATANMNAVLVAGEAIAGSYEAAMDTVGKKVTSLQRYFDNSAEALGQAWIPAYESAVDALTNSLKWWLALEGSQQRNISYTMGGLAAYSLLAGGILSLLPMLAKMKESMLTLGIFTNVANAGFLAMVGPILAVVAAGAALVVVGSQIAAANADQTEGWRDLDQEIANTSTSYYEYLQRRKAAGEITNDTPLGRGAGPRGAQVRPGHIGAGTPIMTQAQWTASSVGRLDLRGSRGAMQTINAAPADSAARAADNAAAAAKVAQKALDDLGATLTGQVGPAMDEHRAKINEINAAYFGFRDIVNELTEKKKNQGGVLNKKDTEALAAAKKGIEESTAAIDAETAAYERNMKMMALDMLQRELLARGMSPANVATAIGGMAQSMGLIDEKTANMMSNIGNLSDALMGMDPSQLLEANGQLQEILIKMGLIQPKDVTVTITTIHRDLYGNEGRNCVLAGTQIATGLRETASIETLAPGDHVVAYDFLEDKLYISYVTETFISQGRGWYELDFGEVKLRCSPSHPIWVDHQMLPAKDLQIGDVTLRYEDGVKHLFMLSRKTYHDEVVTLYNLNVAQYHTFLSEGIVVHNYESKAAGGLLTSDMTLVGERGQELIVRTSKGLQVLPNYITEGILKSGGMPNESFALDAGGGGGGVYTPPPINPDPYGGTGDLVGTPPGGSTVYTSPTVSTGGSAAASVAVSAATIVAAAAQASTTQTLQQVSTVVMASQAVMTAAMSAMTQEQVESARASKAVLDRILSALQRQGTPVDYAKATTTAMGKADFK